MTIDFYYAPPSPFCRSVLLTAKAIGLDMNLKLVDISNGENMKPEFIAINPQHCVPTLVDGDLKLWESRAICTYLISKYAKDDSLYPKDLKTRANIDRLLYFDMGTLFQSFMNCVRPVFKGEAKSLDPEKIKTLQEALGFLNIFLEGHDFAVGNSITVADFVLVACVETFDACEFDLSAHKNVMAWLERCRQQMTDYDECNANGAKVIASWLKGKTKQEDTE
ncbi:glutathione S-transferase D1-like [Oratosquilla oratoria]|uniref:glutathione S-transferase D1-like n=1 Tax=Oratosquilla oratoria TaxID=337810 RepID=UPI003F763D99